MEPVRQWVEGTVQSLSSYHAGYGMIMKALVKTGPHLVQVTLPAGIKNTVSEGSRLKFKATLVQMSTVAFFAKRPMGMEVIA